MLAQVFRKAAMLEVIHRLLGFISNLLETHANQNSTGDMISDNSGFATLTTFRSGGLFGFSVKLLDLPSEAV